MTTDKVSPGQKLKKPSARLRNTGIDVAGHWDRQGPWDNSTPPKHTPRNYSKVKVRNVTGDDLRRGEVVEFTGFLLADGEGEIEQDCLWFEGDTPDETNVGWGITLQPIPGATEPGEIDWVLVLGACIAWVKITSEDHEYATRVAGEVVLQSAASGPVKILHKPDPGEESELPEDRECVVQIMDEGGNYVDIVRVISQDLSQTPPQLCFANSAGLHAGKIKRYNVETDEFTDKGDCWIRFVDDNDNLAGDVPAIYGEWYGPGRYSGMETFEDDTWPLYTLRRGELPAEIVMVSHEEESPPDPGDVVEANADGYHPGAVVRYSGGGGYFEAFKCWIQFVEGFDGEPNSDGQILACQNEYYGPARYSGVWDLVENEGEEDETHDKRPVYVCECSERAFVGVFDEAIADEDDGVFSIYHSHNFTDSGINKSCQVFGDPVEANTKGIISRVAGRWLGAATACQPELEE